MEQAEAEPITDAEAEAVLLALGKVLDWEFFPQSHQHPHGHFVARAPGGNGSRRSILLYRIFPENRNYLRKGTITKGIAYVVSGEQALEDFPCPYEFKDIESAKNACERHHATGKWSWP